MTHKEHYHDGKHLVSITELQSIINKPFLEKWKQGLCDPMLGCGFVRAKQIADEAAELGNTVHKDVEQWFNKTKDPESEWGKKIVHELKAGLVKPYLIRPEDNLIDKESMLAGSPDLVGIGDWPDHLLTTFIGDYKIKNRLDSLTGLQGVGYRYLIKRLHNVDIKWFLIFHCDKKSKNQIVKKVWINLDEWTQGFKALVTLWNYLNPKRTVYLHE